MILNLVCSLTNFEVENRKYSDSVGVLHERWSLPMSHAWNIDPEGDDC